MSRKYMKTAERQMENNLFKKIKKKNEQDKPVTPWRILVYFVHTKVPFLVVKQKKKYFVHDNDHFFRDIIATFIVIDTE